MRRQDSKIIYVVHLQSAIAKTNPTPQVNYRQSSHRSDNAAPNLPIVFLHSCHVTQVTTVATFQWLPRQLRDQLIQVKYIVHPPPNYIYHSWYIRQNFA